MMDRRYINGNDWRMFEKQFPSAFSFLLHASLNNELSHLRFNNKKGSLNDWQTNRLAELETWKKEQRDG